LANNRVQEERSLEHSGRGHQKYRIDGARTDALIRLGETGAGGS
jgi:hypothetical protein